MTTKRYLATAAAFLLLGSTVHAESLNMSGATAAVDDGRPTRGMTQQGVQAKYGPTPDHPGSRGRPADYALGIRRFRRLFRIRQGDSCRPETLTEKTSHKARAATATRAFFCNNRAPLYLNQR